MPPPPPPPYPFTPEVGGIKNGPMYSSGNPYPPFPANIPPPPPPPPPEYLLGAPPLLFVAPDPPLPPLRIITSISSDVAMPGYPLAPFWDTPVPPVPPYE